MVEVRTQTRPELGVSPRSPDGDGSHGPNDVPRKCPTGTRSRRHPAKRKAPDPESGGGSALDGSGSSLQYTSGNTCCRKDRWAFRCHRALEMDALPPPRHGGPRLSSLSTDSLSTDESGDVSRPRSR